MVTALDRVKANYATSLDINTLFMYPVLETWQLRPAGEQAGMGLFSFVL